MEESTLSRLCRALSSILTIFTPKQVIPKPEIEVPTPITNAYIDEKHQIEKNNIEQNARDNDPE